MKKLALLCFICFSTALASAQRKYNAAYVEGGGNALYYSINYDRVIPLSQNLSIAPRVGFAFLPWIENSSRNFGSIRIPTELNVLWSKDRLSSNFVEVGIGMSFIQLRQNVTYLETGATGNRNTLGKVTLARLGYRYQKPEGGLMFRAGVLVPVAEDKYSRQRFGDDIFYRVWAGIGLGYSF